MGARRARTNCRMSMAAIERSIALIAANPGDLRAIRQKDVTIAMWQRSMPPGGAGAHNHRPRSSFTVGTRFHTEGAEGP